MIAAAVSVSTPSPVQPFVLHLLCMPFGGSLMPTPDADTPGDSPAHAQWTALRALAHRAIGEESLAITHVLCTRSEANRPAGGACAVAGRRASALPSAELTLCPVRVRAAPMACRAR